MRRKPGTTRPTPVDIAFRISITLKGIDGVLELIGGLLLLLLSPRQLDGMAQAVFQHELLEDPHDFIATRAVHLTAGLDVSATLFGAAYLLLHGLVKVVLVWAVLREKLWAFPWMIAFLVAFILYQSYEMLRQFTLALLLLTLFDLLVTWLTLIEYRKRRLRLA